MVRGWGGCWINVIMPLACRGACPQGSTCTLSLSLSHTHWRVHLDLIKHREAHYQRTFLPNYFSPVSRQDVFLTFDKPISVFFFSFPPSHSSGRQLTGMDPNITFSKLNLELNELLKQSRENPLIFTGHNVEPRVPPPPVRR